ncbi:hypothetical protein HT031_002631 [Scenedesmus sp. PABB004]|nr:hypothetical protein HT031_002631 [Scenedesmus sp. PABB004]
MTVHEHDEEDGNFWHNVNKLSKNPDRPKRNSKFIGFLFVAGCAGVVLFAVLAVMTMNSRTACPCANPYRILGNGEKLLDQEQCMKDQTYVACYDARTRKHHLYAGLAGGSGGVVLLSLLLFRYG